MWLSHQFSLHALLDLPQIACGSISSSQPILGISKLWKDYEIQIEQFYEAMQNLTREARTNIDALIAAPNTRKAQHVKWLADWHKTRDAACDASDNCDEEKTRRMA